MTPLPQQLEDKKKELKELHEEKTGIEDCYESNTRLNEDWDYSQILKRMEILEAEVAILEQAIAEIKKRDKDIDELAESSTFALCALMKENKELKDEMQKQRQEEIEFLEWIYETNGEDEDFDEVMTSTDRRINRLKQQLNQPKTEE